MKLKIKTPSWAEEFLNPHRYKGAYGGRGCVHKDTKINAQGGDIAISEFQGGSVYSYDEFTGEVILTHAEKPKEYTVENLYTVTLEGRKSIIVTDEHKFYRYGYKYMPGELGNYEWVMLKQLSTGDYIKISSGVGAKDEKVVGIKFHSREKYWDLHVPETECYFAEGILNHNTGKSHFFAELLVEMMILNFDLRVVCIREVQQTLSHSVKALIEGKIESLGVGAYFDVQTSCIKSTKGDGIVIFQGMNNHTADSIKSLEGFDVAFVEEAQSLSQRSLDLLRPTIRKEGSELWFAWNPRYETDPIDVFLRGANPPPDTVCSKVTFEDNPWFPDVLKVEMEYDKGRDIDKFNHVWMGEYECASEARIFKNWRVEEFETDKDAMFRFGADWGYSIDPTVLIRNYVQGRTLYIDYEAYQVGCEIDDTPALFLTIPGAEKWPIIADSSSPERISHMNKQGFNIIPARKGPKSIEEGISFLQGYDIVVHPRCVHTIDELTYYKYKTDPLTDIITPIIEDKNNHVIDSIRYSAEAERRLKKGKTKHKNVIPIPCLRKFNR